MQIEPNLRLLLAVQKAVNGDAFDLCTQRRPWQRRQILHLGKCSGAMPQGTRLGLSHGSVRIRALAFPSWCRGQIILAAKCWGMSKTPPLSSGHGFDGVAWRTPAARGPFLLPESMACSAQQGFGEFDSSDFLAKGTTARLERQRCCHSLS